MPRLQSETFTMVLTGGQLSDGSHARQTVEVSLAYDSASGLLHDIIFVGRGKIGQGLDLLLSDLGIQLSRAIQGRDPQQGELPL
jgi:hypothetical protein